MASPARNSMELPELHMGHRAQTVDTPTVVFVACPTTTDLPLFLDLHIRSVSALISLATEFKYPKTQGRQNK
jgi:hypothetical protein